MSKLFNIKKIAFTTLVFICFFAFQNKVSAKKITCNYEVDDNGAEAFAIRYETTGSSVSIEFNAEFENWATGGNGGFKASSVDFTPAEAGDTCPQTLFSVNSWKIDDMKIKFFLSKADAKKKITDTKTYDIDNEAHTYTLTSSVDHGTPGGGVNSGGAKRCTLFLFNSTDFDETVVQFYQTDTNVPEVAVDGKLSTDSKKYVADFTNDQIATCPAFVYMTLSHDDSAGVTTYTFTLTQPSADKYATFKGVSFGKKTNSTGGGTGCDKIKGIGKYIKAVFAILRYAFPTLIIILSVIEFLGVVLSGEDEKMEKAKKHFITRILIGILIIFLPYLLEMVLNIAGVLEGDIADAVCNFISK